MLGAVAEERTERFRVGDRVETKTKPVFRGLVKGVPNENEVVVQWDNTGDETETVGVVTLRPVGSGH